MEVLWIDLISRNNSLCQTDDWSGKIDMIDWQTGMVITTRLSKRLSPSSERNPFYIMVKVCEATCGRDSPHIADINLLYYIAQTDMHTFNIADRCSPTMSKFPGSTHYLYYHEWPQYHWKKFSVGKHYLHQPTAHWSQSDGQLVWALSI